MIADYGSRGASRLVRLVLASMLALTALGVLSAGALAAVPYQFNEPTVRAIGDEEVVFDAAMEEPPYDLKDQCSNEKPTPTSIGDSDIPDVPARAYRSGGQIVLFSSHYTTRRFIGPNFNQLTHPCDIVMQSGGLSDAPRAFHDHEWINSFWTTNGTNVYGLVHEEFQGWRADPINCQKDLNGDGVQDFQDHQKCWRNSITLAKSTNGGATFTAPGCLDPTTVPCNLIASSPYQFNSAPPIGPYGYFNPSNIVEHEDGYLYAMVRSLGSPEVPEGGSATPTPGTPDHPSGVCLIRTANNEVALANPASWQAWNGTGFSSLFVNPYPTEPADKAAHVCKPLSSLPLTMSGSLTYSQYFEKYVVVDRLGSPTPGVYFSTSSDLINWSTPKLIMKAEVPPHSGEPDCVAPHPVRLPSLIDHTSGRRNFDTIDRTPYLYFTRAIMEDDGQGGCFLDLNRDLVRIKIEFDSTAPPPSNPPPSDPGGGIIDDEPPVDTNAAQVTISSRKKQDVDKLVITIRLNENAIVEAAATVNVPGASRVYSFKTVRKQVVANKRVKLRLKLAKKSLKRVKRALRRGKKLTAKVKITATDGDGNNSVKRSKIKLKP